MTVDIQSLMISLLAAELGGCPLPWYRHHHHYHHYTLPFYK